MTIGCPRWPSQEMQNSIILWNNFWCFLLRLVHPCLKIVFFLLVIVFFLHIVFQIFWSSLHPKTMEATWIFLLFFLTNCIYQMKHLPRGLNMRLWLMRFSDISSINLSSTVLTQELRNQSLETEIPRRQSENQTIFFFSKRIMKMLTVLKTQQVSRRRSALVEPNT